MTEATELLEADGAMVYLLDPATGRLRFAHDAGVRGKRARDLIRSMELEPGTGMFGRAVAERMAHVAGCLEGAAVGQPHPAWRALPALSDFAAGDQVAVAGHDLLAALDLVGPDDQVWVDPDARAPARTEVERAQRLLADLRRRL